MTDLNKHRKSLKRTLAEGALRFFVEGIAFAAGYAVVVAALYVFTH